MQVSAISHGNWHGLVVWRDGRDKGAPWLIIEECSWLGGGPACKRGDADSPGPFASRKIWLEFSNAWGFVFCPARVLASLLGLQCVVFFLSCFLNVMT